MALHDGKRVLKDSSGKLYKVAPGDADRIAKNRGWTDASDAETSARANALSEQAKFGGAGDTALAVVEKAARTATGGLAGSQGDEMRRAAVLDETSPVLSFVAQAAGSLAPAAGAGAVARGLGAGKAAVAAAEGLAAGYADEAEMAAVEQRAISPGNVMLFGIGGELAGRALPALLRRGARGVSAGAGDAAAVIAGEAVEDVSAAAERRALERSAREAADMPPGPARSEALRETAEQQYTRAADDLSSSLSEAERILDPEAAWRGTPGAQRRVDAAGAADDPADSLVDELTSEPSAAQQRWTTDTALALDDMATKAETELERLSREFNEATGLSSPATPPYSLAGKSLEDLGALPFDEATDRASTLKGLRASPEFAATGRAPKAFDREGHKKGITLLDDGNGGLVLRDGRHRFSVAKEKNLPTIGGRVLDADGNVLFDGDIPMRDGGLSPRAQAILDKQRAKAGQAGAVMLGRFLPKGAQLKPKSEAFKNAANLLKSVKVDDIDEAFIQRTLKATRNDAFEGDERAWLEEFMRHHMPSKVAAAEAAPVAAAAAKDTGLGTFASEADYEAALARFKARRAPKATEAAAAPSASTPAAPPAPEPSAVAPSGGMPKDMGGLGKEAYPDPKELRAKRLAAEEFIYSLDQYQDKLNAKTFRETQEKIRAGTASERQLEHEAFKDRVFASEGASWSWTWQSLKGGEASPQGKILLDKIKQRGMVQLGGGAGGRLKDAASMVADSPLGDVLAGTAGAVAGGQLTDSTEGAVAGGALGLGVSMLGGRGAAKAMRRAAKKLLSTNGGADTFRAARTATRELRKAGAPAEAVAALQGGLKQRELWGRAADLEDDLQRAGGKHSSGMAGLKDQLDPATVKAQLQKDPADRAAWGAKLQEAVEGIEDHIAVARKWGLADKRGLRALTGLLGRARKALSLAESTAATKAPRLPGAPQPSLASELGSEAVETMADMAIGAMGLPPVAGLAMKGGRRLWQRLGDKGQAAIKNAARQMVSPVVDDAYGLPRSVLAASALSRFTGDYSGPQEAFDARVKTLDQLRSNPTALPLSIAESLGTLAQDDPRLHQQIAARIQSQVAYVDANLPPEIRVSLRYPRGMPPSQMALRDFAVLWNSTFYPDTVLDDLVSGKATPTQMRVLRDVHPDTYADLQSEVMFEVGSSFDSIRPQTLNNLDILFESDGLAGASFSWRAAGYIAESREEAMQRRPGAPMAPPGQAEDYAPPAGAINAIRKGVTNRGA